MYYQLAFRKPTSFPCQINLRNIKRESPKCLYIPLGRFVRLHRFLNRVIELSLGKIKN